ncbi:MAG: triose-phosphate isomerase [Fusobacteriaceae bacterium]|nr:triose-phosphate isomerase [Fusobacteriaceae bacterium]
MRKKIVAGNWKMNKTNCEGVATINELKSLIAEYKEVEVIIGAPAIMLSDLVKAAEGSNIKISAQNMYNKDSGAFTGEISPVMLKAIGVNHVILGHSERREYFGETDAFINEKVKAALAHGITPILCVGEKLEERESGKTLEVNSRQVKGGMASLTEDEAKKVIIAYEPVWAIGTGKTATPEMAQETHKAIREVVREMFGSEVADGTIIQYGGSMNAANAAELMAQPDIDGGLVGGASLDAKTFAIVVKTGN